MEHPRKKLRYAIVNQLKAASSDAGDRVYPNRYLPMGQEELPAILVYSDEEAADPAIEPALVLSREAEITIDSLLTVNQDGNVDDQLDQIAAQVEHAMNKDPSFGDLAMRSYLKKTKAEFFPDGEQLIGSIKLTFAVTYHSNLPGQ